MRSSGINKLHPTTKFQTVNGEVTSVGIMIVQSTVITHRFKEW